MQKHKLGRPRVFIGSSQESLDYAYAIQQNLEDDAEVTVWTQGIFELTKTSVESLAKTLDKSDFAIFVFAPSDTLHLRQKKYKVVRDNVVFELGLFMGKLGRERTFIVVPKDRADLRIPTDLAGITPGKFDANRKDKNLEAAFGPFCNAVRGQIRRRGKRARSLVRLNAKTRTVPTGRLLIIEARYGVQDHRIDVTKQLKDAVVDDKLHVLVGNQLAGDPSPNVPKDLVVRYKYKNQALERIVEEGKNLDLPSMFSSLASDVSCWKGREQASSSASVMIPMDHKRKFYPLHDSACISF